MRQHTRYVAVICTVLAVLLVCSACRQQSLSSSAASFDKVVQPYRFNFLRWELAAFTGSNNPFTVYPAADIYDTGSVLRYIDLANELSSLEHETLAAAAEGKAPTQAQADALAVLRNERQTLEPLVERIVAAQVTTVLQEADIYTPMDRYLHLGSTFPRIWFKLDDLPHLLVVSPRDRIESAYEAMLLQELDAATTTALENQIAGLGASGLVVPLGGFGATYPSFVSSDGDLRFILHAVSEEWLHQYLAFTPLGFRYVLDLTQIKPDYAVATMNETLASMISEEIAERVITRFYDLPQANGRAAIAASAETFDFNHEMRQIRLHVDELLANGQVDEAEAYMAERQLYLAQHGYYIRKLNQAYFAFYGTYADAPTSVDPIGDALRALRVRSDSLSTFLNTAVTLRSKEQLFNLVSAN